MRDVSGEIVNLTHFTIFDDFKRYVNAVPQERLAGMFKRLFDLSLSLAARFDAFDADINSDYETYVQRRKRSGWLTALLLAVRFPQECVFYRQSLIKFAQTNWGATIAETGSRGERYVEYLKFIHEVRDLWPMNGVSRRTCWMRIRFCGLSREDQKPDHGKVITRNAFGRSLQAPKQNIGICAEIKDASPFTGSTAWIFVTSRIGMKSSRH